jgi:hypothetical protein
MYDKRFIRRHRGISSVLAMLYLTLFSALAVGFYASVTTAVQVSYNDQHAIQAFVSADSGLDFMRYQLAHVMIPPNTASSDVVNELAKDLKNHLNGTTNMHGLSVAQNGNTINVPGPTNEFINLDSTGRSAFRATITDWAGEIVVKVTGRYASPQMLAAGTPTLRTITMDFTRQSVPTTSFNYAVASKGSVVVSKGSVTAVDPTNNAMATIMSASPISGAINMSGGTIGGDLNVVAGGSASVTGGTVANESSATQIQANHVHTVSDPDFPVVDTTIYKQYATNLFVSGASVQQNIRIPAGTNPKFTGGDTVRGIMYVESPNTITFRGNFNLPGFLVFENKNDETVNVLDFRGNVTQAPLPADAQFDALRATTGVAILAPTASVKMSGSTDSLLKGNLILGTFAFNGSADIQIDQGTLMTLNAGANSANFGGKTVKFTATGANNLPKQGVSFSTYYVAKPSSYQEIMP